MATTTSERDPRHHPQKMQRHLQQMVDHLRQDTGKVDEPQFKAMCETAAEVLVGLKRPSATTSRKNEKAWRT